MRFHLTDEQELLQNSVRRTALEICDAGARRAAIEGDTDFHAQLWDALAALGALGILAPEEYGGAGLGVLDAALAIEALGEAAAPGPFLSHLLATYALARTQDSAVKRDWLAAMAAGEAPAALAFTGGWTAPEWNGEIRDGRLTATARFVVGAVSARAFLIVLQDGALALAPASDTIFITPEDSIDRTRRVSTVRFEDTPCAVLSEDPALAQDIFDVAAVLIAADALGGAQTSLKMSVDYAQTRVQFGRPIAEFQAIRHELADMAVELEPSRALVWYAAHAIDSALADRSRMAALAKAHLCDRFISLTRHAVLIHGGIGYTWEYDLQILFRRALFDHAWLGAPSVHRARAADLAGW